RPDVVGSRRRMDGPRRERRGPHAHGIPGQRGGLASELPRLRQREGVADRGVPEGLEAHGDGSAGAARNRRFSSPAEDVRGRSPRRAAVRIRDGFASSGYWSRVSGDGRGFGGVGTGFAIAGGVMKTKQLAATIVLVAALATPAFAQKANPDPTGSRIYQISS